MKKLFYNGKIYTMKTEQTIFNYMIVSDGIIQACGEGIPETLVGYDEVVDLQGQTVLPGFNDSHLHLLGLGMLSSRLILRGISSYTELKDKLSTYKATQKIQASEPILAFGFNEKEIGERTLPTKEQLDQIEAAHPLFIIRACGHLAVMNSQAITYLAERENLAEQIGIEKNKDGTYTGIVKEKAIGLIYKQFPVTEEVIKSYIQKAIQISLSLGITSVQTDDLAVFPEMGWQKIVEIYKQLAQEDQLAIRIYEQTLFHTLEPYKAYLKEKKKQHQYGRFQLGPLKLVLDGSLGGRTAALRAPYQDDAKSRGVLNYSYDDLKDFLTYAYQEEEQVAIHCIGDRALAMVVAIWESLAENYGYKPLRNGIVHCQVTDVDLVKRCRALGLIIYSQPIFLDSDIHIVEDRLGERAQTSYKGKEWLDLGVVVALGSDAPVDRYNPFDGIYCAVSRKDLSGYPAGGFLPEQALSRFEAVKGYTYDSAYASFEEQQKGLLEKGYCADFIVVTQDYLKCTEEDLKDIKVVATYVGGICRYTNKKFNCK